MMSKIIKLNRFPLVKETSKESQRGKKNKILFLNNDSTLIKNKQ